MFVVPYLIWDFFLHLIAKCCKTGLQRNLPENDVHKPPARRVRWLKRPAVFSKVCMCNPSMYIFIYLEPKGVHQKHRKCTAAWLVIRQRCVWRQIHKEGLQQSEPVIFPMMCVWEIRGVLFHLEQKQPHVFQLPPSLFYYYAHIHKHEPAYSRRTPLKTWPQPLFPTWSSLMQPPTWADTRRFPILPHITPPFIFPNPPHLQKKTGLMGFI